MAIIILLLVVGALGYRVTTPEQRERWLTMAVDALVHLKTAAKELTPEEVAFRDALRSRLPRTFVTLALVFINAIVFSGMLFGAGAIADPATLISWGASLGTRTTNGEWWRLFTSPFVHTGLLHLVLDAFVLIQLGGILERLVGRWAFGAAYVCAGVFCGLTSLSVHPIAVTVAPSGAIFGLYGLLLGTLAWQAFRDFRGGQSSEPELEPGIDEAQAVPAIAVPLAALKRLGVGGTLFVAYTALNGFAGAPELTALLVGLGYGLVLTHQTHRTVVDARQVGIAAAVAVVAAAISATTLRHIADVKPEIAFVLATEQRTASAYQAGFDQFQRGRLSAEKLAEIAEGAIPALQAADARLDRLYNVPPEDQPLVADAREYLRLRCTSWRARAGALRKAFAGRHRPADAAADARWRLQAEAQYRSDLAVMGSAEGAERASLAAFQRISQASPAGLAAAVR